MNARDSFQMLVRNLKLCPTLETKINTKLLHETWSTFRRLDPEHGDEVTPALLVSLILFDVESFAEQYELAIKPKNQVGQLLAATIKENEKT
jgi:hypothetical protein